jgi:hypothetical protein
MRSMLSVAGTVHRVGRGAARAIAALRLRRPLSA